MPIRRHVLTLESRAPIEFHDISDAVRTWVRAAGVRDGLLTVSSPHTTGRITINEVDPALQRDMVAYLERMAPAGADYGHNTNTVDGRDNAHSHILGLFIPASEGIQVIDGDLALGTWQALFFVELDGPRSRREVHLQLLDA
jgi:secondary thiamine-phosphate synthase enzyme